MIRADISNSACLPIQSVIRSAYINVRITSIMRFQNAVSRPKSDYVLIMCTVHDV